MINPRQVKAEMIDQAIRQIPGLIDLNCAEDREKLEALRREATAAGDEAQVAICDHALAGDEAAIHECARVLRDAQAH